MKEHDRDQEEKKKNRAETSAFYFPFAATLGVSNTTQGIRRLSLCSQPVIVSQHILKLSRKIAIFYKTHNPVIFSDHTLCRICKQTKNKHNNKNQVNLPCVFRSQTFGRPRGRNGYIWNLYFPEGGQTAACPSLQRAESAHVHNESS